MVSRLKISATLLILAVSASIYGQTPPSPPPGDDGVPVDGITALFVVGALYGAKKLNERKNSN
jgi:hypothetical protein